MLVLVGSQGIHKSKFVQVLGHPWAVECSSPFGTKDAMSELDGAWIVEVPELAGMRRSDVETTKHFISRASDRYRPAVWPHRDRSAARLRLYRVPSNEYGRS
jgi:predicted P-loop ATPase